MSGYDGGGDNNMIPTALIEAIVLMLFMLAFAYSYITLLRLYAEWKDIHMDSRRAMALSLAGLAVVLVSSGMACLWLMGRI